MPEPPHHFSDDEILNGFKCDSVMTYELSLGLLLKVRIGTIRIIKRFEAQVIRLCKEKSLLPNEPTVLKYLLNKFTEEGDRYKLKCWSPGKLFKASWELSRKALFISNKLVKMLNFHPLYPPEQEKVPGIMLRFEVEFVKKVADYHKSVKRPDGTFSYEVPKAEDLLAPSTESQYNETTLEDPEKYKNISSSYKKPYKSKDSLSRADDERIQASIL